MHICIFPFPNPAPYTRISHTLQAYLMNRVRAWLKDTDLSVRKRGGGMYGKEGGMYGRENKKRGRAGSRDFIEVEGTILIDIHPSKESMDFAGQILLGGEGYERLCQGVQRRVAGCARCPSASCHACAQKRRVQQGNGTGRQRGGGVGRQAGARRQMPCYAS